MTERYQFSYGENTVYQSVVELLSRFRISDAEVVVDIGCGFGAIAEPVTSMGLTYLGFDRDPVSVGDLQARTFESDVTDFEDCEHAVRLIDKRIGDRRLAAIVMIDTLEHLTNGGEVMTSLQRLSQSHGGAPLIVAVPNVTHVDMAGKLLLGRWDMTETGILDDTHFAFFSEHHLTQVMRRAGWLEVGAHDFELAESDQHFPSDAPTLQRGAPLRELLYSVREHASAGVVVNEFVRVYAPVATPPELREGEDVPFLSVLVRTQNRRPETLEETLLSLAAQTCDDFEVLLLTHDVPWEDRHRVLFLVDVFPETFKSRVRVIPVEGGGRSRPLNVGLKEARGEYVAVLDDDDVAFIHWVDEFRTAARRSPGRVLRALAAEQEVTPTVWGGATAGYDVVSRPRCRWSTRFDLVEHLYENHSPPCGWAVPRSFFRDMGVQFDESLPVLEDWDFLLQAASWCGVVSINEITALWRRWQNGESSTSVHSEEEWNTARRSVLAKLDSRPLLLPAHSATTLSALVQTARHTEGSTALVVRELDEVRAERNACAVELQRTEADRLAIHAALVDAHARLDDVWQSASWKATKPFRLLSRLSGRPRRSRSSGEPGVSP